MNPYDQDNDDEDLYDCCDGTCPDCTDGDLLTDIESAFDDWREEREPLTPDPLDAARGIVIALALSLPIWALIIWWAR